jgi:hypothetical protein
MRRSWVAAVAVASSLLFAGCLPASIRRDAAGTVRPTLPRPSPTVQPATECQRQARVFEERSALGDAFRLVIEGRTADGVTVARGVRARLAAAIADAAGIPGGDPAAGDLPEAEVLQGVASIIDDPDRPVPDRQLILVQGRALLPFIDRLMNPESGSRSWADCPDLVYPGDPVAFPPPPTAAELGIPGQTSHYVLEPHLAAIDGATATIIGRLGGEPGRARVIRVDLGKDGFLEVIEGIDIAPAAFASALAADIAPGARPTTRSVSGFEVIDIVDRIASTSVHVATRGDRMVVIHDLGDSAIAEILAAFP